MTTKHRRSLVILAALATVATGCDQKPLAIGDTNSIIVSATPELWAQVKDVLVPQLERTIFTTREEKVFTVTYHNPADSIWLNLRRFRQLLVIGTADDFWVAPALRKVDIDREVDPPGIAQVEDVWARNGQTVTVLQLPDTMSLENATEVVSALGSVIYENLDLHYRQNAVAKMFVTGPDTALARRLGEESGFVLTLPTVYEHRLSDTIYIFRNDNPDPSELIREIAVTWQSPVPEEFGADAILAWRAELVAGHYNFPQVTKLIYQQNTRPTEDNLGYTVQTIWENPPDSDFPAGGPAITKAVICPSQDRLYLIDAWLYAPGRDKYEYMIQLEEILGSFACVDLVGTTISSRGETAS